MAIYFYTETAFHHEGNWDYLVKLIDLSKDVGAHGVKFQVVADIDNLTSSRHPLYEKLTSCVFSKEQWMAAFRYCHQIGLDVIMMPLDEPCFELVSEAKSYIKYLDIHSISFYDLVILEKIKKSQIPLIIGVGGRSIEEIEEKIDFFGDQFKVIMIGFQSYPSKLEDIKLERIKLYKNLYPSMSIGYADHSSFDSPYAIKSNEFAYLLGATFFEKHITLDEGQERLDFQSAMGGRGIAQTIDSLSYLDQQVFRYDEKGLMNIEEPETTYRNRQKVVVAKHDLKAGEILTVDNTILKMTLTGEGLQSIDNILYKKLINTVEKDVAIQLEDIQ